MQHDEVIWQVIRHNHCSFMAKITTGNFCRNPYNITGVCNRSSCPLANSRYATIRDHDGVFYLYMKTIERAHKPNELWERVKLPRNYEKALEIIDKHLMYWPKFLVHKDKTRLTKMTQMRIRMRKLALKTREKIMTTPRKEIKRESRREKKAETAAELDKSIEKELLERLNGGLYGDIHNILPKHFNKILDENELHAVSEDEEYEEEPEIEYVQGYDDLEEEDDIEDFGGFAIDESLKNNGDASEDEEEMDSVDGKRVKRRSESAHQKMEEDERRKSKKKAKVLVEVEREDASERQRATF
ncbi:PREDICTED: protein MAK16 homolog [Populus euphratica]|uniref:Protein MAK16 homolog n=1 Tax=Populus euphratica TaxID=75702 RepID=A0AAJ6Y395_POPEU|nr:PREDICTED: protein MAK16 homolog [Populus euphratica]